MKSRWTLRTLVVLALVVVLGSAAVVPAAAGVELGFDVRFSGVIATVGETGEAWVIGGTTVATDTNTDVVLTVSPAAAGLWADVAAKKQTDGTLLAKQIIVRPEQVRVRGIATTIPEGNLGDWVVAGVTINVTADTKISDRSGPIAVGQWVEVVGTEDAGVLTATHIIAVGPQDAVMVSGEIQSFSDAEWVISGIKLAVNDDTLISGTPVVGLIGHAAAELQEDGSLLAKGLRVAWIDRTASPYMADFEGVITALPPIGLRGVWKIDDQAIYVMPSTRIHQEKGQAVVGATVHVVGWKIAGQIIASEITVLESPVEGGEYTMGAGFIEALPTDVKNGIWTIGGKQVLVNERTTLQGATPEVGRVALYEGIKRADGVTVAGIVRVHAMIFPIPTGTIVPPPIPTRPPKP